MFFAPALCRMQLHQCSRQREIRKIERDTPGIAKQLDGTECVEIAEGCEL